ncbi:MAG: hypothetical protein H6Q17_2628 [Bacteroidetes bacterium]|nr:hypothetical protein [Bacteroidota bacterium]
MNKQQKSALSMFRRVYDFLVKNLALLSTLPMFTKLLEALELLLKQIEVLGEQQEKDISGLTTQKENLRSDLIKKVVETVKRIKAYAVLNDKEALLQEVDYSETLLNRYTPNDLVNGCMVIYNAGQKNLSVLAEYGVTADTQTVLKSAIDAFKVGSEVPKEGTIEKKQTTDQLEKAIADTTAVLKKIDLLVDMLENTQPELFNEYYDTRPVVVRKGSMTVRGMASDSATGDKLKGVKFVFRQNGTVILEKMTADGGSFYVKSLNDGEYQVSVSRIDYVGQEVTLNIPGTGLIELKIALVKK